MDALAHDPPRGPAGKAAILPLLSFTKQTYTAIANWHYSFLNGLNLAFCQFACAALGKDETQGPCAAVSFLALIMPSCRCCATVTAKSMGPTLTVQSILVTTARCDDATYQQLCPTVTSCIMLDARRAITAIIGNV